MVYVMGVLGFIGGFIAGQMMLFFLLRHRSREELLSDKSLKWAGGLFNWLTAALGAYVLIRVYQDYFGG